LFLWCFIIFIYEQNYTGIPISKTQAITGEAEIPFEVVVSDSDELFPPGLSPDAIAIHIARKKAIAVQHKVNTDAVVLAADTIVVLNENIIGKPVHREEAVSILYALSGEKHKVITG
jgi:septum formation protein